MTVDRLDIRHAIGRLVKFIDRDTRRAIDAIEERRSALHKVWREKLDEADQARRAFEACRPQYRHAEAIDAIEAMKTQHPDLLILDRELTPHICPVVCAVSGLAIFEGDEILGEIESGPVILRAAVTLAVNPVELPEAAQ